MPNFFNLTLDTTGPSNPTIALQGGAQYATGALINASIGSSDSITTGYQMKLWGDIDLAWAKANGIVSSSATKVSEADALWITYVTTKQLQLTAADGNKTVNLKLRDDVYNESAQASDSIILDTTRPVVTITGPDVPKISKIPGKDVAAFSFTADSAFTEYKVKVVSSTGAAHDTGSVIPTAGGSSNMTGTGTYTANSVVNCTIDGSDLESASAGDGQKIIKVFVKDDAGHWSA